MEISEVKEASDSWYQEDVGLGNVSAEAPEMSDFKMVCILLSCVPEGCISLLYSSSLDPTSALCYFFLHIASTMCKSASHSTTSKGGETSHYCAHLLVSYVSQSLSNCSVLSLSVLDLF